MSSYQHPFTREYLSRHPTHFDNTPNSRHEQLMKVMSRILYDISCIIGKTLLVDSCYRSPQVNALVGGKRSSFHTSGSAVDILTSNLTENEKATLISCLLNYYPAELVEHPRHVHAAFDVSRLGNYGKIMTWQYEHPSEFPRAELTIPGPDSDL